MVTLTPAITAALLSEAEPVISALFCAKAGKTADAMARETVSNILKRICIVSARLYTDHARTHAALMAAASSGRSVHGFFPTTGIDYHRKGRACDALRRARPIGVESRCDY